MVSHPTFPNTATPYRTLSAQSGERNVSRTVDRTRTAPVSAVRSTLAELRTQRDRTLLHSRVLTARRLLERVLLALMEESRLQLTRAVLLSLCTLAWLGRLLLEAVLVSVSRMSEFGLLVWARPLALWDSLALPLLASLSCCRPLHWGVTIGESLQGHSKQEEGEKRGTTRQRYALCSRCVEQGVRMA